MRTTLGLIAAIASFFFASTALAAEAAAPGPAPVPAGVWQGKIGKYPVIVRLADAPCSPDDSGYYYLSHLAAIHLQQNGSALNWKEGDGDNAATWTLDNSYGDTLGGKWTSGDGKRTLPIALKKVGVPMKDSGSGDQCEAQADAYNKPRVDKTLKGLTAEDGKLGTLGYRTLSVKGVSVSSFEIPPGAFHVPKLNKAMRAGMGAEIASALGCADDAGDRGGDYDSTTAPTQLLFGHILLTQTNVNAYCGGAHPDNWSTYGAWDLAADTPVNASVWVAYEKTKYGTPAMPEKLTALLLKHAAPADGDCSDALSDNGGSYAVSLGSAGLVFHSQLPHVIQACNQDIEVPFAQLMPYLTPEGKKAVKKLMKEAQKH